MLKKMQPIFVLLLIFGFSAMSVGNEWANYYFPDAVGSYWTYEDQDGNELTRYAIAPEDIDGETYRAFSYDPALEDWADFEHYTHPYFYQVGDDWVAFFVGAEIENGLKAHTAQEMEEALPMLRQQMLGDAPEGVGLDLNYDIEVTSADYFYLLPTPVAYNEEMDSAGVKCYAHLDYGYPRGHLWKYRAVHRLSKPIAPSLRPAWSPAQKPLKPLPARLKTA